MRQQPPALDNKNFILAIVLSTLIIFAWQYFYVAPIAEREQAAQAEQQKQVEALKNAAPVQPSTTSAAPVTRDAAMQSAPRVTIDTPELAGSISLKGAVIDDLKLKKYHVTVNPASGPVTLLSPSGSPNAYFAEHLLIPAVGSSFKVPTPETVWTVAQGATLTPAAPLVLTWDNGEGLTFRREISISDSYVFAVKQSVENKTDAAVAFTPFARLQRQDTPYTEGFYVFFEGLLGVQNKELTELYYSDVSEPGGTLKTDSTGGWLGFTDKYWGTALIPDQARNVTSSYQYARDAGRDVYQTDYQLREPIVVAPGTIGSYQDHVFAGAKVVELFNVIGARHNIYNFDLMIDWGMFKFLTKPMYYLLAWAKSLVGNFGLAILLVTVLVKLAVFPLANKSYASMSKMKKLQPELEALKKQHGDDRMAMQKEMMELYKREKVSPVSGCLPIFVQIPVFFALYKVILTSIELRHAPFYGWIRDLSVADPTHLFNLFGLLPWTPPAILAIGIWPILMGITMWIQMKLNPAPTDPIQASMFNWMPLIFTFMMGSFPAGLVIYWTWSNLLSILQQGYIMKKHGVEVDILGNIRDSLPWFKKKTA